ncbi:hypothetical protein EEW87_004305 [Janibacter melonis]|uniref:Terminase n=1 Tax=Janibacter melonis TaxID=262209 RepID=A0A5P8FKN2_9MICO|nr:terminase large subunit [Janibacter melonis]QFQ29721.2 hypothetical protein EEW87_004305 [Janibacter melonis]
MVDLCAGLGLHLDPWQVEALEVMLGEKENGDWAARTFGLSVARQQGKSSVAVARILAGILLFDEQLVVLSAQATDTAKQVFQRLIDVVEDNPSLKARVDKVNQAPGREVIRFKTGQQVLLKARSTQGMRGFSADLVICDEGQILTADSWAALLPTLSARPNPQVLVLGTPPSDTAGAGAVFAKIRAAGMRGAAGEPVEGTAWLEWSAEAEDDLDDEDTWRKANPAYPYRIPREAVLAERASMSDHEFRQERLGVWASAASRGVVPTLAWEDAADEHSRAVDRLALGVEVGPDLAWASVSVAGQRADGAWHVELVADQNTKGRGVGWVVPLVEQLLSANPEIRAVVVDVASPVSALLIQRGPRWFLKRDGAGDRPGVAVHALKVKELGAGCAALLSGVVTGDVHHIDQPQLTAAALAVGKRPLGDTGMWVWNRRSADSDVTPIQAATYALVGAVADRPTKPGAARVLASEPGAPSSRGSRRAGSRRHSTRR